MKVHKRIWAACLAIMLVVAVFAGLAGTLKVSYAYDEKAAIIKVNSSVYVRTGAGTGNETVKAGSQDVQLSNGKEVTIIDEAPASDGSLWYKIRFTYTDNNQYEGFVRSDFVAIAAADDAFEAYLNEQGFPDSYKPALRTLHASYPNWSFKAFHTNLDWNASLDAETVLGRNLVHNASSPSSWKSVQNGAYNWDTSTWISFDSGGWVMASREIVQYYMDPRNFLTDQAIFMFLYQSYNRDTQNKDGLSYIVANTFLNNNDVEGTSYSDMLMAAAEASEVSPYVLASAILQEMGSSGSSGSISGETGFFNFYNIGAFRTSTQSAVQRGLWYAQGSGTGATSYGRPWNTRQKAIVGGAMWYGEQYVRVGQNTIYLKKFNVQGSNPYSHQYMTNVGGAYEEAVKLSKAYSGDSRQAALEFSIPVFQNMPGSQCQRPSGNGSPNYLLSSLQVEGYDLSPAFDRYTTEYSVIVGENVGSVNIGASAYDGKASISGIGSVNLNVGVNSCEVKVTAQNGTTKSYMINIAREGDTGTDPGTDPGANSGQNPPSSDYRFDDSAMVITEIKPSTPAQTFLANVHVEGGSAKLLNQDGSGEVSGEAGTGNWLVLYDGSGNETKRYQLLIYGDANGDGKISSTDLLAVQKHILKMQELGGVYLTACDANHDGRFTATDLLEIQKHILKLSELVQH